MGEGHFVYGRQPGKAEDMLQARCALCRVALTQAVDDLYAELCNACEQSAATELIAASASCRKPAG
jgi:hypothetical protein